MDDGHETHLTGPANFLFTSRPNPFHHSAVIRFSLARAGQVEIGIHDVTGGVYWVAMSTEEFNSGKKMIVLR